MLSVFSLQGRPTRLHEAVVPCHFWCLAADLRRLHRAVSSTTGKHCCGVMGYTGTLWFSSDANDGPSSPDREPQVLVTSLCHLLFFCYKIRPRDIGVPFVFWRHSAYVNLWLSVLFHVFFFIFNTRFPFCFINSLSSIRVYMLSIKQILHFVVEKLCV